MKITFTQCLMVSASLLLLSHLPATNAAESFGRLFTTTANRSQLNYLRQTQKLNIVAPVVSNDESTPSAPIVLPEAIIMQGYVKRTDGKKSTVWVNNQAVQENDSTADVQIGTLPKNDNQVPLKLPANGKNFSLKAGQMYSPADNSVSEAKPYAVHGEEVNAGVIGDDATNKPASK